MKTLLQGKKSYIIAVATIVYGILGYYLNYMNSTTSIDTVLAGLSLAGLRHGLTTEIASIAQLLLFGSSTRTTVTTQVVPPIIQKSDNNKVLGPVSAGLANPVSTVAKVEDIATLNAPVTPVATPDVTPAQDAPQA